jgi:hypothetical protein
MRLIDRLVISRPVDVDLWRVSDGRHIVTSSVLSNHLVAVELPNLDWVVAAGELGLAGDPANKGVVVFLECESSEVSFRVSILINPDEVARDALVPTHFNDGTCYGTSWKRNVNNTSSV